MSMSQIPKRKPYRVRYPGAVVTVRPGDMVASLQRVGLGDLASTLSSLITTGVDITTDPYFPEVLCRIQQLAAIQSGAAVPACTDTPSGLPGGVGLDALIWPLRYYVYAKQHIWVIPLTIFAVIYIPFAIGRGWDK